MNTIMPFSNVFAKGIASLAYQAGGTKTADGRNPHRASWWFRYAQGSGMTRLLKALGLAGLLGIGVQQWLRRVGDRDRDKALMPLGTVAGGSTGQLSAYLSLPADEDERIVNALVGPLMDNAAAEIAKAQGGEPLPTSGAREMKREFYGFLPSLNPVLAEPSRWGLFWADVNPLDSFGRPVLSQDELALLRAGENLPAVRAMAANTWKVSGLENFIPSMALPGLRPPEMEDNPLGRFLGSVPVLSRFVKVSDRGILEEQRAGDAADDVAGQLWRVNLGEHTRRLQSDLSFLQRIAPEKLEIPQLERLIWLRDNWAPIYDASQREGVANLRMARDKELIGTERTNAQKEADRLLKNLEEHSKAAAEMAP
jgi:hypothetical protein